MQRHRVVLLTLAVLVMLPAAYLATKDVRFQDRDCGTAILTSDPNKGAIETGNRVDDDFRQEVYSSSCAHRVMGQRLLILLPVSVAIGLWIAAMRWHPRERIPGDSVI